MKVTIGKMHGTVDIVFLRDERVIGSTTFCGKTTSSYNRNVAVDGMPDQIVIDQIGPEPVYTEAQIREGFLLWEEYVASGGATQDISGYTIEQMANGNSEALIGFIKGDYK